MYKSTQEKCQCIYILRDKNFLQRVGRMSWAVSWCFPSIQHLQGNEPTLSVSPFLKGLWEQPTFATKRELLEKPAPPRKSEFLWSFHGLRSLLLCGLLGHLWPLQWDCPVSKQLHCVPRHHRKGNSRCVSSPVRRLLRWAPEWSDVKGTCGPVSSLG